MSGFRNFIMRGNLVQLAVAVVIGTQFSTLVHQFVESFVTPLLGVFGQTPSFSNLSFHVGQSKFAYGAFLTDALSFLLSALVIYYLMVLPVTKLIQYIERNRAASERLCPECTMSIPVQARRCPQCTADIVPASGQPPRSA